MTIDLKGTKDGLILIVLERRPISKIMEDIEKKFSENASFFKGGIIAGVDGIILSDEELEKIRILFEKKLNIPVKSLDRYARKSFISIEKTDDMASYSNNKATFSESESSDSTYETRDTVFDLNRDVFTGLEEGVTKFVKGTMRSGRNVEFAGNVVILGDVNHGAEVVAFGNVIVIGSLRGVVHAGANGNDDAYIVANKMLARQLRISRIIMRAEDDAQMSAVVPEMAFIKENSIVIEPFL